MLLSLPRYPHMPMACKDGVKHLIGNSKSVAFNYPKFLKESSINYIRVISTFKDIDDANTFVDKFMLENAEYLSSDNNYEYFKYVYETGAKHIIIDKNFIEMFDVLLISGAVKGDRDVNRDIKISLVKYCIDAYCILCKEDILSNQHMNTITFGIGENFRTECLCNSCVKKVESSTNRNSKSSYFNKNLALIEILKNEGL